MHVHVAIEVVQSAEALACQGEKMGHKQCDEGFWLLTHRKFCMYEASSLRE